MSFSVEAGTDLRKLRLQYREIAVFLHDIDQVGGIRVDSQLDDHADGTGLLQPLGEHVQTNPLAFSCTF
jgi:hypothetical protein